MTMKPFIITTYTMSTMATMALLFTISNHTFVFNEPPKVRLCRDNVKNFISGTIGLYYNFPFYRGGHLALWEVHSQHWEILYLLFSIVSGIKMEKFYGRPLPTVYISNTQMYSSDVHELEMQLGDYF